MLKHWSEWEQELMRDHLQTHQHPRDVLMSVAVGWGEPIFLSRKAGFNCCEHSLGMGGFCLGSLAPGSFLPVVLGGASSQVRGQRAPVHRLEAAETKPNVSKDVAPRADQVPPLNPWGRSEGLLRQPRFQFCTCVPAVCPRVTYYSLCALLCLSLN